MTGDEDTLFVYGTLRRDDARNAALHGFERVHGDMPFPTVTPSEGSEVLGQVVEVDDWHELDEYEGFKPGEPGRSLYWRVETSTGVQLYVGNPALGRWGVAHTAPGVQLAAARAEVELL